MIGLELYARLRVDRAVDHDDRAVGHRLEGPVGTAQHLADTDVVDHANCQEVRGRAQFCRRGGDGHTLEGCERGRATGPERGGDTCVDDPLRHRGTLATETDEADARVGVQAHHRTGRRLSGPSASALVNRQSMTVGPRVAKLAAS